MPRRITAAILALLMLCCSALAAPAFSTMEGENWSRTNGVQVAGEGGGNAGYIENGDWAGYFDMDFGGGATGFTVCASTPNEGGTIELRLDSETGPLIGTCYITNTGGWDVWEDFTCEVRGASGVHDLYLVFRGGGGYLFDVNYFRFTGASAPVYASDADELTLAERYGLIPDCLQGVDLTKGITLAEYAALAVRVFETLWQTQEVPVPMNYPGVAGHRLQRELEKAYGLGLVNCFREDRFSPDWTLGRHMAAMLFCYLVKSIEEDGWTYETDADYPLEYTVTARFEDEGDIDRVALDSVYYLTSNGLMDGRTATRFDPVTEITREEAIITAKRIYEWEGGEVVWEDDWEDWDGDDWEDEDWGDFMLSMDPPAIPDDAPTTSPLSGPVPSAAPIAAPTPSDCALTVQDGALQAGTTLAAEPVSQKRVAALTGNGGFEQVYSPVNITAAGYDGSFFGSDVTLTVPVSGLREDELDRYVFAYYDEQADEIRYFWPDGYDPQAGTISIDLPHLSPWWGAKLTRDQEVEAFLDDYCTRLAVAQSQSRQAASELEPYIRAKAQALGLTRQATEDLVQSAVNYLGGQFQGNYKDTVETGTKAVTAITRGVIDDDLDGMRSGLEDALNGAIMHGWEELKFGERLDQVLGSEFAGSSAGTLLGNANGVARMAGRLAGGDLEGAAEELGGVMQNVFPPAEFVTKGARFLAAVGDTAFTYWKSSQIEELYQVYKNGARGLFGNEVVAQNRESFLTFLNTSSGFTLAKGVKRFYNMDKIGEVCERYGWNFQTYSELPERYREIFDKRAEDGLMQYFETRVRQEAEAAKIKEKERECVQEMLNPNYGVLRSDNFQRFFGESSGKDFSVTARLERLVKVRQFISQYVDEDALEKGRKYGFNYGMLLNEWVSLASRYKKSDAITKFIEYLKELGFLKQGIQPQAYSLELMLEMLQGFWNEPYTDKNGKSGVSRTDFCDMYLSPHSYGKGEASLDPNTGDLVITYQYTTSSVTVLSFHFVDRDHVLKTNPKTGKTVECVRAE